jgi:hypothetical protein
MNQDENARIPTARVKTDAAVLIHEPPKNGNQPGSQICESGQRLLQFQ